MNNTGIKPLNYNVLLKMPPEQNKTKAGIIVPNAKTKLLYQRVGQIVDMGCDAFTNAFNEIDKNKPSIGDYVMFNDHAGKDVHLKDELYRLVSSDEIRCVITEETYLYFSEKL